MNAPDWIWYGRDSDGKSQVSFGRWQAHKCQLRYKLAAIQPTEHDHTHVPLADALAVPEVAALVEALAWYGEQSRLARLNHSGGDEGRHAIQADGGKRASAALRAIGGDA